jgi:glycosyltransferase involved in cell wall biosynthesis
LESINRFYGTSLSPGDFEVKLVPWIVRKIAERTPTAMALIKDNYLLLKSRPLGSQFNLIISANNEVDVGRRCIQYIHYPKLSSRPDVGLRWFHRISFVVDTYRWLAMHLTGFSLERMRRNLSLVNSDFIGERVRALHGVETLTLFPPVTGSFHEIPWECREDGFVCVGRISPEKRLERIIEILSTVRSRGGRLHLHVIGTSGNDAYANYIKAYVNANRTWVSMHESVPRQELAELLATHRYGIHAMDEEHFGMAVAEMVRAGCIVFAPDSGGPVQILGGDTRLLYISPKDAAEKILSVISSDEHQKELRDCLAVRGKHFSELSFMHHVREVVSDFESD